MSKEEKEASKKELEDIEELAKSVLSKIKKT